MMALRARRDRGFDGCRIDVERVEVDVGEDRYRIRFDDGRGGGEKRVRRDDDLVFGLDACREQGDAQRDGAVGDGDAVPAAVHRGEALLELCDLVPSSLPHSPLRNVASSRSSSGLAEDRPGRERAGADGCASEKSECVHACEQEIQEFRFDRCRKVLRGSTRFYWVRTSEP